MSKSLYRHYSSQENEHPKLLDLKVATENWQRRCRCDLVHICCVYICRFENKFTQYCLLVVEQAPDTVCSQFKRNYRWFDAWLLKLY